MEDGYTITPEQMAYAKAQVSKKRKLVPATKDQVVNKYQTRLGKYTVLDGTDYIIDEKMVSKRDANGHMKDGLGKIQGKLPTHPTFSTESPYSNKETPGGVWDTNSDGVDRYTPSECILSQPRAKNLRRYFDDVEK